MSRFPPKRRSIERSNSPALPASAREAVTHWGRRHLAPASWRAWISASPHAVLRRPPTCDPVGSGVKQDSDGPAASDDTALHDGKGRPLDDRERVDQVNQALDRLTGSYNRGRRIEGYDGASLFRSELNG